MNRLFLSFISVVEGNLFTGKEMQIFVHASKLEKNKIIVQK